ncbi:MAG: FAD-binding protein, partial [Candidatus Sumerlaeota bacterium]|nr:FAD-binding protein [Candidatus Sumerlaeota bacterium]
DILIAGLVDLVGEECVLVSGEERAAYSYDASRGSAMPDVVVMPRCTDDVQKVIQFASRNKIPVYPRGAGTGMTGGSIPRRGGIALVMTSMNRILDINPVDHIARVQPGVILEDLKRAVKVHGLFYPPDPASAKFATIGGTVAVNSGGLNSVKYGVTRDYVLALEVVTGRGEVMRFGAGTLKSVTSLDVTRLLVGSEGTLAVITEITVKLLPHPRRCGTFLAAFPDDTSALRAAFGILKEGLLPCAMEFMDEMAVHCAFLYAGDIFLKGMGGALLIEFDDLEPPDERGGTIWAAGRAEKICFEAGAINTRGASDVEGREEIWEIRRSLSPAIYEIAPSKMNEDICVPHSQMPVVILEIKRIAHAHGIHVVNFAHVGDGNIHVNFMYDNLNEDEVRRTREAVDELLRMTVLHGGTISGEHGIGLTKAMYLPLECGASEIALMHGIKEIFDPDGIMNPDKKIFTVADAAYSAEAVAKAGP